MSKELSCIRWDTEDPHTKSKNQLLSSRLGGGEGTAYHMVENFRKPRNMVGGLERIPVALSTYLSNLKNSSRVTLASANIQLRRLMGTTSYIGIVKRLPSVCSRKT
jgi:hypothetical protein